MIKKYRIATITLSFFLALIVLMPMGYISKSVDFTTYYPKETDEVLNNPLTGWAPDARSTDYPQPIKLVFALLTWKDIEPQKGVYDFDFIEKEYNFKYWHEKNVKIILRIVLDYSSDVMHKDIPDWLYDELKGDGTWYDGSVGKGFSPNYENPLLISYHKKLIAALGDRYDRSGDIAFIELGSIGHWGEWHTLQSDSVNVPFPRENIVNKYIQQYVSSFPDVVLLMRKPFETAKKNNFGLYNDMFGDPQATINSYLDWINNGYFNSGINKHVNGMPDFWTKAPSGGELSDGEDGLKYFNDDSIEDTLLQAKATHLSWLGPNTPAGQPLGSKNQVNYNKLLSVMGYRFVLNQISYTNNASYQKPVYILINLTNKGSAPFYYKWPVVVSLIDNNGNEVCRKVLNEDIRTWLPGLKSLAACIYITNKINPGDYKVTLSVVDPNAGMGAVKFANDGKQDNLTYEIGIVRIK